MYGKTFNDVKINSFKGGVNDDVTLNFFGLVEVDTDHYNGKVLDIIFVKEDGSELKDRLFPIDEDKVRESYQKLSDEGKLREIVKEADGGKRVQTEDEFVESKYKDFNSKVKHIVCNYVTEEQFNNAVANATDFDSFVLACTVLLPSNFPTMKGSLIATYSGKYVNVPSAMWVTGAFWSVGGKHVLKVSDRIKTQPVGGEESTTDSTDTTTTAIATQW